MAKTLDDLINNLTKLEQELKNQLPKIVAEYAQSAQALVIYKIQHQDGVDNGRYSTKEILVTQSSFLQKAKFKPDVIGTTLGRDEKGKLIAGGSRLGNKKIKNNKGEKINAGNIRKSATEDLLKWIKFPHAKKAVPVMTLPGGYRELRSIQGLQVAHVDLTYSGRMFQNIKILSTENKAEFIVIAMIGGVNKETKDKLLGNYKRFGDFLAITPKIADVVNEIPANRINEIVKTVLG